MSLDRAAGMVSALVHLMEADVEGLVRDAQLLGFLPADMPDHTRQSLLVVLKRIFEAAKLQKDPSAKAKFRTAERRKQFRSVSRELNQV